VRTRRSCNVPNRRKSNDRCRATRPLVSRESTFPEARIRRLAISKYRVLLRGRPMSLSTVLVFARWICVVPLAPLSHCRAAPRRPAARLICSLPLPSFVYQYFDVPQITYDGLLSAPSVGSFLAWIHRRSWVRVGRALGELRAGCGRGGAAGLAARGVPLRVSARAWSAGRTGCSALWRPGRMSEQHRPGGLPGPGVGQVQPDAASGGRDPRRDGDQFPADRRRGRFR
jgi:hypothetical protein